MCGFVSVLLSVHKSSDLESEIPRDFPRLDHKRQLHERQDNSENHFNEPVDNVLEQKEFAVQFKDRVEHFNVPGENRLKFKNDLEHDKEFEDAKDAVVRLKQSSYTTDKNNDRVGDAAKPDESNFEQNDESKTEHDRHKDIDKNDEVDSKQNEQKDAHEMAQIGAPRNQQILGENNGPGQLQIF